MSHTDTCTRSLLDFFSLHLTIAQELECRVLCRMFSLVTYVIHSVSSVWGFPGGSVVKNPPTSVGGTTDVGAICGSGRSLEEGNGNPLQCSCLGNPMDAEVWWATVRGGHKRLGVQTTTTVNNVYVSIPIAQFFPPHLSPLVSMHLFSVSVSLFLFCK